MTNNKLDVNVVVLTTGTVHSQTMKSIVQMVNMQSDKYNIIFGTSQRIMVDNNRNNIVKKFLESNWDYLIMIDEDNPPNRNPLELLDLNKDVMVCPTPIIQKEMNPPIYFAVYNKEGDNFKGAKYKGEKLQRIYTGGTGCIIIKRQVLEAMKAPFESEWNEDGTRGKGSDLYFCEKANKKGFEVWTHWDYICSHYKTVNLLDILEIIKNQVSSKTKVEG